MLLLLTSAALALELGPVTTTGEGRLIGSLYPDFQVDEDGTTVGQGPSLDSRLRVGLDVPLNDRVMVRAEGDAFAAQIAGSTWNLGSEDIRHRDSRGVLHPWAYTPRRLSLAGNNDWMAYELGLQTSHWGMGLLANDGAHDPLFGRNDGGDVVLRARAGTQPLGKETPLYLTAAVDRVYADDIGRWIDGVAAYQGVLALLWRGDVELGTYGVYRHQREADRDQRTNIGAVDVYTSIPLLEGPLSARLRAEAVGIFGATTRAASYNSTEGLAVSQGAVVGALELGVDQGDLLLRGGWMTADSDPYDEGTHDFGADPNFDVGMVLFDEVMGAIDAQAYNQLNDPSNIGQAPDGADVLVSEGAVRKASWFQPVVRAPVTDWLEARAGAVLAWGTAPYAQAFYSGRRGGNPTTHLNEAWSGSYQLGTEFDWALDASPTVGPMELGVVLQGGYLLPGKALGMSESVVMKHMLTVRTRW